MITATLALLAAAAIFNAIMDATENENFRESIFKNLDPKFWYKRESWKHAKRLFGYRFDAWHLAKSAMVICLVLALKINLQTVTIWALDALIMGGIWNLVFTLFYHKIFKVK